jgi:hypothetical protein
MRKAWGLGLSVKAQGWFTWRKGKSVLLAARFLATTKDDGKGARKQGFRSSALFERPYKALPRDLSQEDYGFFLVGGPIGRKDDAISARFGHRITPSRCCQNPFGKGRQKGGIEIFGEPS